MQTLIVYISALLLVVLLARSAQKKDKRKTFLFAALILALVAGLRAESVGIDTKNYAEMFKYLAEFRFNRVWGVEESFKYICAFLLQIWNSNNFVYFVFAWITNWLIFKRLWDFKDLISLPWAASVYIGIFYFMTFNVMRQFVAVAVVFFATRYLAKKKYVKFFLLIAAATLFHKSAILGLGFVLFDIFSWKRLNPRQRLFLRLVLMASPVILVVIGAMVLSRYMHYFSNIQFNFGIMLLLKFALFILTAIVVSNPYKNQTDEESQLACYSFKSVRLYYCTGIFITMLGYLFTYMDRIGLYFYLFESVYIAMMMKSKKTGPVLKFFIAALYLLLLLMAITGTAHGQGEYLFFWQSAPTKA